MTDLVRVQRWWGRPTRVAGIPRGDLVLGVVLSALITFLLASRGARPVGLTEVLALTMTAPVAWRQRAPLAAAGALAGGALANGLLAGSSVRCGAALPAVFLVIYSAGFRLPIRAAVVALGLCIANVAAQAIWDPKLDGPGSLIVLAPATCALWVLGRAARARAAAALVLRERVKELRLNRDMTAATAVAADRARVAEGLTGMLRTRIDELAALASQGRAIAGSDPDRARQVLGDIQSRGRDTLEQMREVVGAMREDAPHEPQPTLAELKSLLQRATRAETRLAIDGDPWKLPAGIELSAYRIVEHLVTALEGAPDALIDVRLRFATDALHLTVSGPAASGREPSVALAQVRQRVALHGGSVRTRSVANGLETSVRLPLVTAYS